MTPASEEKQKKRPLNRKFLLRGVVIWVFLLLLPFAGILGYKQSLYYFYHGLWEQNYQGEYVVGYTEGESKFEWEWDTANFENDELYWQKAEECLRNFGCEIVYNSQYYLPEEIHFNTASGYYIRMFELMDCTEADSQAYPDDCNRIFYAP
jgi:hypothetical protein